MRVKIPITGYQRHVDDVGSIAIIEERDNQDVCSHCGALWTEKGDQYNGGCCEADSQVAADLAKEISACTEQ